MKGIRRLIDQARLVLLRMLDWRLARRREAIMKWLDGEIDRAELDLILTEIDRTESLAGPYEVERARRRASIMSRFRSGEIDETERDLALLEIDVEEGRVPRWRL